MRLYQKYCSLIVAFLLFPLESSQAKIEYLRKEIPARTECTPMRLQSPVLDISRKQTDSPWCYAYASADLLSWELQESVSAADIALLYNDFGNQRLQRDQLHSEIDKGGNPARAMEYAMHKGLCLEQNMPSQDFMRVNGTEAVDVKMITMIANIESVKRYWDQVSDEKYVCKNTDLIREIFPQLNDLAIGEILMKTDLFHIVDSLWEKNCESKRKFLSKQFDAVEEVSLAQTREADGIRLLHRLDQLLTLKKPIGLVVRAPFVGLLEEKGTHAINVIGRRLNSASNECEYLVRDSNASACTVSYHCDDTGEAWVSESLVQDNLESLFYLREKK